MSAFTSAGLLRGKRRAEVEVNHRFLCRRRVVLRIIGETFRTSRLNHGPEPFMTPPTPHERHAVQHGLHAVGRTLRTPATDLVRVGSRRWFLQTGLAGFAGL